MKRASAGPSRHVTGLRLALALAAAAGLPAGAQSLYKCGNTYSQTPCEPGAQAVRVHRDAAASAPGLRGPALCRQAVQDRLDPRDPQTALLRVEVADKPGFEMLRIGQEPVAARRYEVALTAPAPQGAVTRLQTFQCVLSEDEARLLVLRTR